MDRRSLSNTELLIDQIQRVRDDIVEGSPVVFAFRARRRVVISGGVSLVCWMVLGAFVLPALLMAFTSLNLMIVVFLSPVTAQLLVGIAGQWSSRALALSSDGSVIVARVQRSGSKVSGIEKIYQPTDVAIEPLTPRWRTQRIFVDGDVWFHCDKGTHFVPRSSAGQTLVDAYSNS